MLKAYATHWSVRLALLASFVLAAAAGTKWDK